MSMLRIPGSMRIGAVVYAVTPLDPTVAEERGISGLCDPRQASIHIDTRLAQPMQAEVVIHEALHAMLNDSGYSLGDDEEGLVEALAPRLMAWLVDNEDVVLRLQRMVRKPEPAPSGVE